MAKFGRTYASHDAHSSKYNTFKLNFLNNKEKNLRLAQSSGKKGGAPLFELGVNKFSDMSEEEFLTMYGTLKESEHKAANSLNNNQ